MDLPIFTLTWGFDEYNKFGLMYISELINDSQDFSFFMPVPVGFINGRPNFENWEDKLFENDYYFPFELNGELIQLQGELKYPELNQNSLNYITSIPTLNSDDNLYLSFKIPDFETISFQIDIYSIRSFYRTKNIGTKYLHQYLGAHKDYITDNSIFVPIIPINIPLMNQIYFDKKGIFLGYSNVLNEGYQL